jgi:hypothetical protein
MKRDLEAFKFSEDEAAIIESAMKEKRPWDCSEVEGIRRRIKEFHLAFGENLCCYCYRDLTGEFNMVIDVEHVAPKRFFKDLTFNIKNLSVACKRCNMKMKRDKLDFLNEHFLSRDFEDSNKYKLVHPNIDSRDEHLERIVQQRNAKRLVKYVVLQGSDKGLFAYTYFQLNEFEIESYDDAQGANFVSDQEGDAVAEIRDLVRKIQ